MVEFSWNFRMFIVSFVFFESSMIILLLEFDDYFWILMIFSEFPLNVHIFYLIVNFDEFWWIWMNFISFSEFWWMLMIFLDLYDFFWILWILSKLHCNSKFIKFIKSEKFIKIQKIIQKSKKKSSKFTKRNENSWFLLKIHQAKIKRSSNSPKLTKSYKSHKPY